MSFYRVIRHNGMWWFLSPHGERFFSLGVNCANMGEPEYSERTPSYCAMRFYTTPAEWTDDTLSRLRRWGFNTIGGWSDVDTLRAHWKEGMPYTMVLHIGSRLGMPWNDMFSPQTARQVDELMGNLTAPYRDDPYLLGWFTDNEQGWWDDSVFLHFVKQPAENATRRELVKLLRRHYKDDLCRMRADFDIGDARRFEDVQQATLIPGGSGMQVINAFIGLLARRYYGLMHEAIRRYDRNHLILGDRYIDFYPLEVARAAAPYVDVVSTNHGADWIDGSNSYYFLYTLHRLSAKPVLVTEFYFCAHENRSGNKNTPPGTNFPTVQTQRERAEGARRQVMEYARRPYVIGAHWFQYYDEPTFGRSDGENYNMGLVDIHNQPYEELTSAYQSLPVNRLHAKAEPASRKQQPVPPANSQALAGLHTWDKRSALVLPDSEYPVADLYVCWEPSRLLVAVHASDWLDASLYPLQKVPREERMQCSLRLQAEEQMQVTVWFGDSQPAEVSDDRVECQIWNVATRHTAILAIPARLLSKGDLRRGDTIHLEARFSTHSRAESTNWSKQITIGG